MCFPYYQVAPRQEAAGERRRRAHLRRVLRHRTAGFVAARQTTARGLALVARGKAHRRWSWGDCAAAAGVFVHAAARRTAGFACVPP